MPGDLPDMLRLETECFPTDRISPRSLRHILLRGRSVVLVADRSGRVAGYAMVLFNSATGLARIYSLCVDPAHRGRGIAGALLTACEREAVARGRVRMRLEARADNAAAQRLYQRNGYRQFARRVGYYEDGADAVVMEKPLSPGSECTGEKVRENVEGVTCPGM